MLFMRNRGIIAYGTADDRARLAMISKLERRSGSETIIKMIRERYAVLFGEAPPA
jgi:hypothetical protein